SSGSSKKKRRRHKKKKRFSSEAQAVKLSDNDNNNSNNINPIEQNENDTENSEKRMKLGKTKKKYVKDANKLDTKNIFKSRLQAAGISLKEYHRTMRRENSSNMATYIMSYIAARVDKNISDSSAVWLSALGLGCQGLAMPIGNKAVYLRMQPFLPNDNNIQMKLLAQPLLPDCRRFTDPELLDRVPNVFLVMGSILAALQLAACILVRMKPISKEEHEDGNEEEEEEEERLERARIQNSPS
ncbi:unnamed protein product, partial [Schistosoma margrebowiei]